MFTIYLLKNNIVNHVESVIVRGLHIPSYWPRSQVGKRQRGIRRELESSLSRTRSRGKIIHEPRKLVSQILIQSETLVGEVFLRVLPSPRSVAAIFFFFSNGM